MPTTRARSTRAERCCVYVVAAPRARRAIQAQHFLLNATRRHSHADAVAACLRNGQRRVLAARAPSRASRTNPGYTSTSVRTQDDSRS